LLKSGEVVDNRATNNPAISGKKGKSLIKTETLPAPKIANRDFIKFRDLMKLVFILYVDLSFVYVTLNGEIM